MGWSPDKLGFEDHFERVFFEDGRNLKGLSLYIMFQGRCNSFTLLVGNIVGSDLYDDSVSPLPPLHPPTRINKRKLSPTLPENVRPLP